MKQSYKSDNKAFTDGYKNMMRVVEANKTWLESKERQGIVNKLMLLGLSNDYLFDEDKGVLQGYVGNDTDIILPDIFIYGHNITKRDTTSIVLNKHMKVIGPNSIKGGNIRKVVLNEGLEGITSMAFYDTNMEELILPSTLKYIERYAFNNIFEGEGTITVLSKNIGITDILDAIADLVVYETTIRFSKDRKKEIQREWDKLLFKERLRNKFSCSTRLYKMRFTTLEWV